MTVPAAILAALGRLNSHARTRGHFGTERNAIYTYKTLAALVTIQAGEATVRVVKWTGKCNRCTNGRFHHWDSDCTSSCWHCDGTGCKTLTFTETTLPGGHVWHHPWQGPVTSGLTLARANFGTTEGLEATPVVDWAPNLPGDRLPIEDLAALLNQVEAWVETSPSPVRGEPYWYVASEARRYLHRSAHPGWHGLEPGSGYKLDIGRTTTCFRCGSDDKAGGINYGHVTPLLHWALRVCEPCYAERPPHPKDPPPSKLLSPAVQEWIARHERLETTINLPISTPSEPQGE